MVMQSGIRNVVAVFLGLFVAGIPLVIMAEEQTQPVTPMVHEHCPMVDGTAHSASHELMAQQHLQHMGESSMPFDLVHSVHIFTPTAQGGEQDVVSTNGDPHQIALIREHLKTEAARRAKGDYGTPARIHGASMPGLKDMAANAASIRIKYVELPAGGRIIYTTTRPALITAIHKWLNAQAHDHAEDAMLSHQ
ncbi:hypothetical protein [Acetobacter peroxydans]|nr:hypothetical protein [Acetobacter peroxydans]GBR33945.1 hypothetical protein AA13755_0697 [Acetobacter peroxydans NBRC 13755]GBR44939.1 hypothetical protein AA0475_2333 [Acetobacter peroxydans]